MAVITLTIPGIINVSLQQKDQEILLEGTQAMDIIYFARMSNGIQVGDIIRLGECVGIESCDNCTATLDPDTGLQLLDPDTGIGIVNDPGTIISIYIDDALQVETPLAGDYIFFGKETKVGMSGLNGYYAKIKMVNPDNNKIELFAVSSEVTVSSK